MFRKMHRLRNLVAGVWCKQCVLCLQVVGALINSTFLLALCVSIMLEAVEKFLDPEQVTRPKLVAIVGTGELATFMLAPLHSGIRSFGKTGRNASSLPYHVRSQKSCLCTPDYWQPCVVEYLVIKWKETMNTTGLRLTMHHNIVQHRPEPLSRLVGRAVRSSESAQRYKLGHFICFVKVPSAQQISFFPAWKRSTETRRGLIVIASWIHGLRTPLLPAACSFFATPGVFRRGVAFAELWARHRFFGFAVRKWSPYKARGGLQEVHRTRAREDENTHDQVFM